MPDITNLPSDNDPREKFRRILKGMNEEPAEFSPIYYPENNLSGDFIDSETIATDLADTRPIKTTLATQKITHENHKGTFSKVNESYVTAQNTPEKTSKVSKGIKNQTVKSGNKSKVRAATQPVQLKATSKVDVQKFVGCLLKGVILASFILITVTVCLTSFLFYEYYRIASTLPDINDLRGHASKFETTRILDRDGNTLYEILDPNAGRRTYVPLSRISPYLIAATIATEDKGFYEHPGVDLFAILRAFWQNYQGGGTVSGASTITQQIARALLFTPEEIHDISYQRKIREAILATEITRRYSKDEIIELYLNEIYYGNLAYGIEAAAETYFGLSANQLSLGQAAFLAGLPQAPAIYDVYTNPDLTFSRLEDVLVLMYQTSQEENCIIVNNSPDPICIDPILVTQAVDEVRNYPFKSPNVIMRHPHWVTYIRAQLEAQIDPQTIYRSGLNVYTTIDPGIQELAENAVKQQIDNLKGQNVTNGALVAIRPNTGEILAMVGSADFFNEQISGQVNMAISPRQPGSAIKPLTYLAAFEKGWTPATIIWDVPTEFSPSGRADDPSPVYVPNNFTNKFYGPVSIRTALANSLNVSAVKALQFVGIYDDPNTEKEDGLMEIARRVGITTLNRPDYGLSLTLGGGEVTLLELTGFFSTLANDGQYIKPVGITRIEDREGNVLYEYNPSPEIRVLRSEHVYMISSILSDNNSRDLVFGRNSVLNLPFAVAAKTGTTNSFRDNWTLGYTPDIAIGVWVGNADYSPMENTTGLTGAAPIWSEVMKGSIEFLTGNSPTPFIRPGGIVDQTVCEISGSYPSKWCPELKSEIFAIDQPPLPEKDDLIQEVLLDTWTGLRASNICGDFTEKKMVLNVKDTWARKWLRKDPEGQKWAQKLGFRDELKFMPGRECSEDDPRVTLAFRSPSAGETVVSSPMEIRIIAEATNWFDWVRLDYGIGNNPRDWKALEQRNSSMNGNDIFYEWDLSELPAGPIMMRLIMRSTEGTSAELKIPVNLQVPTPTPTPSPTPTLTPTPTITPTATSTFPPEDTPVPSSTSTETPTETSTPVPSEP